VWPLFKCRFLVEFLLFRGSRKKPKRKSHASQLTGSSKTTGKIWIQERGTLKGMVQLVLFEKSRRVTGF